MSTDNKLNRRLLLQYSGQALLAYEGFNLLPSQAQAAISETNQELVENEGFSILQGLTTETATQLTVDIPDNIKTHYRLVDVKTARVLEPIWNARHAREHSSWSVDKLYFTGLELGHEYFFHVIDAKNRILDERVLKPLDRNMADARIAIGSCMFDVMWARNDVWKNVAISQPDIMFFLGDNVYGDMMGFSNGPKQLWRRYIETRRRIPFYHQRNLVPVLALWDDHDFGKNDSNSKYKHKEDSRRTFQTFFAQENLDGAIDQGPGIASAFSAFGHDFIFGDCRYFRDQPENGIKAFWGAEQLAWAQRIFDRNTGPVWLMQGSQFFGDNKTKGATYEKNYAQEFATFAQMIRNSNRKATFLTGDIHLTEVMAVESSILGYTAHEITSSSMHSFMPFSRPPNARRIEWELGYSHMVIDLEVSGGEATYETTCIGRDNKAKFKLTL